MDFLVCGVYEVGEVSFSDALLFIPECYILTQSLYIVFLQYIPIWVIYFDDFSPSVITDKRLMHHTLYLCKCHPHCSSRPDFVFSMLYGVSVRLSTYMKPSSSPWKGWVNHLNAFHISMRLLMIFSVGRAVLGIERELESVGDIVEFPEFICNWVLCRTEESVQNNSIFCFLWQK